MRHKKSITTTSDLDLSGQWMRSSFVDSVLLLLLMMMMTMTMMCLTPGSDELTRQADIC